MTFAPKPSQPPLSFVRSFTVKKHGNPKFTFRDEKREISFFGEEPGGGEGGRGSSYNVKPTGKIRKCLQQ